MEVQVLSSAPDRRPGKPGLLLFPVSGCARACWDGRAHAPRTKVSENRLDTAPSCRVLPCSRTATAGRYTCVAGKHMPRRANVRYLRDLRGQLSGCSAASAVEQPPRPCSGAGRGGQRSGSRWRQSQGEPYRRQGLTSRWLSSPGELQGSPEVTPATPYFFPASCCAESDTPRRFPQSTPAPTRDLAQLALEAALPQPSTEDTHSFYWLSCGSGAGASR